VCRRQSNGEARSGWRVVAVLHVNLPVVTFNDRLGNGEAKARMASEILSLGSYRVESVKNGFPGLRGNSRTFVVDPDPDFVADSRRRDLD